MPLPPSVSPVTGLPVPPHYIHSSTAHFRDTEGRTILLRGVNLSGAAKAPLDQPAQKLEGFWEKAESGEENFINQPLNLDDGTADVHLARLRAWGFNMLRYVFTWESLEHAGPGKYDYEYMDYIVKVLRKCKDYGFKVFMDPHQDIWSRFSGGSGAPYWTLLACGLNPRAFTVTSGAIIQPEWPEPENPDPGHYPAMIWSTNYTHLVCQTIFTLFWAGKVWAPLCIIDGKNIQDYLQGHYIAAVSELATKIKEAGDLYDECVIGWDSMNEPGEGLIGHGDLTVIPKSQAMKKGPSPTAFQGMILGMGIKQEVENWTIGSLGPARAGNVTVDPKGVKIWLDADYEKDGSKYGWQRGRGWQLGKCIWAQHGVWDPETATCLNPRYFATDPATDRVVDFVPDYWRPHWLKYAEMVRLQHAEAIHFIQPPVFHVPPTLPETHLRGRACLSPHYYDGLTLLTKHWNWFNADALGLLRGHYTTVIQAVKVGEAAIRKSLQDQLGILQRDTLDVVGDYPTLIGEIGIPYDMDDRKAYGYVDGGKGEGDYSAQQKALDASLNGADGPNVLNWTMWTYVPDNSHQWGDNWNGEDLSIWSEDDTERSALSTDYRSMIGGTESQADLTSSASSMRSLTMTSQLVDKVSPEIIQKGVSIPPELIHDGARAPAAFSRPFPTATVGIPERIDFDIHSSTFKMSVKVNPEDISSETVMTEIFLPYIHYASNSSPLRSINLPSTNGDAMTSSITPLVEAEKLDSTKMSIEVDVKTSHGTWELEGQTLKWYYEVPDASKVKVEGVVDSYGSLQLDRTYTIEIKRKGGAIARIQTGATSWFDMCPGGDSCVIM